jgi:hypothetical protein
MRTRPFLKVEAVVVKLFSTKFEKLDLLRFPLLRMTRSDAGAGVGVVFGWTRRLRAGTNALARITSGIVAWGAASASAQIWASVWVWE